MSETISSITSLITLIPFDRQIVLELSDYPWVKDLVVHQLVHVGTIEASTYSTKESILQYQVILTVTGDKLIVFKPSPISVACTRGVSRGKQIGSVKSISGMDDITLMQHITDLEALDEEYPDVFQKSKKSFAGVRTLWVSHTFKKNRNSGRMVSNDSSTYAQFVRIQQSNI